MAQVEGKIKILFMTFADAGNTNAQSLNAREVALRLDPDLFLSAFFYEHSPDPRLIQKPEIKLVRLPASRRTPAILQAMISGPDIIAYLDYSPASWLFVHLPRFLKRGAKSVLHAEAPADQMLGATRLLRSLRNGILPRCEVLTAITDFVARDLSNQGFEPQYTLPVGVDTTLFGPAARQNARAKVLFAGTLIERKGALLVLEAACGIPEADFLLVGSPRGGFEAVLRKKCEELRLTNVQLLGPQPQTALVGIMQSSDIFILPSRLEGLPKVTLEAAATGLPCVVFRDYGTPSVVDGLTGFQVATFEEMVVRLKRLIQDPKLRLQMGAAAVEQARKFDWNVIAPLWQDTYLQIAGVKIPPTKAKVISN